MEVDHNKDGSNTEPMPRPDSTACHAPLTAHLLPLQVDHNKDGELQFGEFCLFIKKIKEGGIHGGGYQEALATQIDELSGSADGYVGAEDIKMMMQVFAETTWVTPHIPSRHSPF